MKLIFRCKDHPEVQPISAVLQVGHTDADKDTSEVLEHTIGAQLNEGMWRILNKFAVVHLAAGGNNPAVTPATERPHADNTNNNSIIFE